ncbi:peptidoglycan-binding domain-containing protein [Paracoccus benzoatiresistens]|uniref:Peptidoglycan-binding domain-containing protein n=1 Tax=Paracoccus benzoatiresistens TaxID=2997341 RepID=A0ABT4J6X1_9RHOB|nr:peptidoglycan-binding domain-containing protein [Paracoccus sp. EF6]MCZ0962186.1 peptidoglycan-binding domain-containing protein [Paracoccus sp. EF6]
MRRLALVVMAAGLPLTGFAQEAVIRIESKRDAEVAAAAARWAGQFDDLVTFPLPRGWTAIAIGPLSPEEAEERISALKEAGQIPQDSFVTVPEEGVVLTRVGDTVAPAKAVEAPAAPRPDLPAPGAYIRLQSVQARSEADAALSEWRKTFPEAGLAELPDGWFGVVLGPVDRAAAEAWLEVFKEGDVVPDDAFLSDAAELGAVVEAGRAPDLPAPPAAAAEMPPLDQVQRALRWAGVYDGEIDGKTGPRTRDAIKAEILAERLSTDPGTAMRELIARRDAWRTEVGLTMLDDQATGLSVMAPMDRLVFDRTERALSIYGPKDGSGAALILFSQPGGQQELLDLSGLVTALGWVPQPTRSIKPGHVLLEGGNEAHIGRAEGWVREGRAEGFVLIWPAADAQGQARIAAEMSDSFGRKAPAANDAATAQPALPGGGAP